MKSGCLKVVIVLLVVLAVAAYFLHANVWVKAVVDAVKIAKEPCAMKVIVRHASNAPFDVDIELVNGKRWRVEHKGQLPGVVVGISDGSQTVSNMPAVPATSLDPHGIPAGLRAAGVVCGAVLPLFRKSMPVEQFDGHTCFKVNTYATGSSFSFNGPVQVWFDSTTGAPVCIRGSGNGSYLEEHFSWLPINFAAQGTEEFFDTAHTTPFFTNYLTP